MSESPIDRERRIARLVGRGGEDIERVVLAKALHDMFYESGRKIAPPYDLLKWPENVRWEMMAVVATEVITDLVERAAKRASRT